MIHIVCPNPAVDRTLLFGKIQKSLPNRPKEIREFPGGKGFNVAYALQYKQPEEMIIHTMLGGNYGQQVADLAKDLGYQLKITKIATNTRICNILIDQSQQDIFPLYERGFELDEETLHDFTCQLVETVNDGDYLVFSGSLMQGMPADYTFRVKNLLQLQGKQVNLCVDTSGPALLNTYQESSPYLVKINDEEILDIFPNEKLETTNDYLKLLQNKVDPKIPYFIITLGKDGVIARAKGTFYFASAKKVIANNPIASGDFFLGRLMAGLSQHQTFSKTLQDAVTFSTTNVLNWYPEVFSEQLLEVAQTITIKEL